MSRAQKESQARRRHFSMAVVAIVMTFFSFAGLLWLSGEAQALRLGMKRIIFEGPKRSDIVTILNNTAKPQTYRLGLRHYRMDERRALVRLEDDDPLVGSMKWADSMIRYAPKRVTVPPGSSQQIRVLLRRPRDLEPGEYRSHLWIVTESEADDFDPTGEAAASGKKSVLIKMQPAMTLPVFVRHGDLKASARITDAKISRIDGGVGVSFVLHRDGDRSLYGDVRLICTGGGKEFVASHVRGIAVYTEVKKRVMEYEFAVPADKIGQCSSARIEYVADKDDSLYSGEVMAKVDVKG